jgi:hypothetical protein
LRLLAPDALEARIHEFAPELSKGLGVEFDGARVTPELVDARIPDVGDVKLARISVLHLRGALPANAKEFRWSLARELGDNVLRIRERDRDDMVSIWLKNGEWSDPFVFGRGIRPRSAAQVASQ